MNCSQSKLIVILEAGKEKKITLSELFKENARYSNILVDLGTGNGKFIYNCAQSDPGNFSLGVDSNADNMREISWKASRKPAKGGLENLRFIVSSIEALPVEFRDVAHKITILYPWGSLLKALIEPTPPLIKKISLMGKDNAELTILINQSIFDNEVYIKKLGLPSLNPQYIRDIIEPEYSKAFIKIINTQIISNSNTLFSTKWGKQLKLGGRKTLIIQAKIKSTTKEELCVS